MANMKKIGQSSLLAAPLLDKGNKDSGNEVGLDSNKNWKFFENFNKDLPKMTLVSLTEVCENFEYNIQP